MPFMKAKRHRAHSVVSGVRVKASERKKTDPALRDYKRSTSSLESLIGHRDASCVSRGAPHSLRNAGLAEFKSVTRAHRRFRTEWNVDPPTSKSIHQRERTLKKMESWVSQTGKYP
ncbi:hypothetical protein TNCV_1084981 [Trichonephila clavipes]|nr:hypothetical protein TNCV_1084981 [Trichonephila clavipes]